MDIEPGDLVIETEDSVCPHAHRHVEGADGYEYTADGTGQKFVVRSVTPSDIPTYEGCFLLELQGLTGHWCFGNFRKLKPNELPQARARKLVRI